MIQGMAKRRLEVRGAMQSHNLPQLGMLIGNTVMHSDNAGLIAKGQTLCELVRRSSNAHWRMTHCPCADGPRLLALSEPCGRRRPASVQNGIAGNAHSAKQRCSI